MLRLAHPPTFSAERAYIFEVLLGQFLGIPYVAVTEEREDVRITCLDDPDGRELRLVDDFFAQPEADWLTPRSMPQRPLPRWTVDESSITAPLVHPVLPILYGKPCANGSYLQADDGRITIGIDIAGSSFFLLTRYEEIVNKTRDDRERFPAHASLAWQEGFLDRPIVNEYVEILWSCLRQLWPGLKRKSRRFQVMLSHDVDWPLGIVAASPMKIIKNAAGDLLYRKSANLLLRRIRSFYAVSRGNRDADLYNTFDWIMDRSEQMGLSSAFYFLCGRTGGEIDGVYELDDPWIKGLLQRIHQRGHEIGLHPSYHTFRDPQQLKREYERLRQVAEEAGIRQEAYGGRQHYLRWEAPLTWQIWADAGLSYDSTLSYADHAGFRCGTCYEFPVFNAVTRKPLSLRERPLLVMECTLLEKQYMNLDREEAAAYMQMLKRRCQLYQGNFTLLWHNNLLVHPQDAELYQYVLQA